jgi:NAD(P)-dependent dehydrogenase (short-subunit alcohol dehydrogenase family)
MANEFLADGWTVYATMRRARDREHLFSEQLAQHGGRLIILNFDVTSAKDRHAVRKALEDRGGGLDCLINNAGYMLLGALEETAEDEIRAQLETNFVSAALLIKELLPFLRKKKGTIINISSIFGFLTWPLTSIYCASKFAIEGLTLSLSQELAPYGVRVTLLEPGSRATDLMTNLRWGSDRNGDPSVYASQTNGYKAYRQKLADREKAETSDVARAALRIANGSGHRVRNPVSLPEELMFLAVRLAPEMIGVRFFGRIAGRLFERSSDKR